MFEWIFSSAFLAVLRYYALAVVYGSSFVINFIGVTASFFRYLIAVVIDIALVAGTKYLGVAFIATVLKAIGFGEALPAQPDGPVTNVYYFILAVATLVYSYATYNKLKAAGKVK